MPPTDRPYRRAHSLGPARRRGLRIYRRRRSTRPGRGFWGRLFGTPLSHHFARQALRAGVQYATVTLGHAGFVPGTKRLVVDQVEVSPTTWPTCVELVGTPATIDSFIKANREDLSDAVLLRMEGVAVSLTGGPI
jgi:PII-like signaling protein